MRILNKNLFFLIFFTLTSVIWTQDDDDPIMQQIRAYNSGLASGQNTSSTTQEESDSEYDEYEEDIDEAISEYEEDIDEETGYNEESDETTNNASLVTPPTSTTPVQTNNSSSLNVIPIIPPVVSNNLSTNTTTNQFIPNIGLNPRVDPRRIITNYFSTNQFLVTQIITNTNMVARIITNKVVVNERVINSYITNSINTNYIVTNQFRSNEIISNITVITNSVYSNNQQYIDDPISAICYIKDSSQNINRVSLKTNIMRFSNGSEEFYMNFTFHKDQNLTNPQKKIEFDFAISSPMLVTSFDNFDQKVELMFMDSYETYIWKKEFSFNYREAFLKVDRVNLNQIYLKKNITRSDILEMYNIFKESPKIWVFLKGREGVVQIEIPQEILNVYIQLFIYQQEIFR